MKKICLYIIVFVGLICNNAYGQVAGQAHIDSVKQFLIFWKTRFAYYYEKSWMLDQTSFWCEGPPRNFRGDCSIFSKENTVYGLDPKGMEIYKYNTERDVDNRKVVDSIYINSKEIAYIIKKWDQPEISTWDTLFFPGKRIVKQQVIYSFHQTYNKLIEDYSDLARGHSYKDVDSNAAAAKKLRAFKETSLWRDGYIKISDPVFLKNGKYAICYYWHYWGQFYIEYRMAIYKKNISGWEEFTTVRWGNIN